MSEQKDDLVQGGAINPLKWNDVYSHREDGGTDVIGWEADTGFGVYYGIDEYWASDSHGWELCLDYEKLGDFDDPDQAKAFAQKHYAERISSAILTPAATDDIDWDTLAEERLEQRPRRSPAASEDQDEYVSLAAYLEQGRELQQARAQLADLRSKLERANSPVWDTEALHGRRG